MKPRREIFGFPWHVFVMAAVFSAAAVGFLAFCAPARSSVVVRCEGREPFRARIIDDGHRSKTADKDWFVVERDGERMRLKKRDCSAWVRVI
jgi:hypothetical protein